MANIENMIVEFASWREKYEKKSFISSSLKKQIVPWGEDNLAPDYIKGLLDKSPEHSSIINGMIKLAIGKGFIIPTDEDALKQFNNSPIGKISLTNRNNYDDLLPKIIRDAVVFGCYALEVRWGKGHEFITDVKHVDVSSVRFDADDDGFWISKNWKEYRKEYATPFQIAAFSDEDKSSTQLLFVTMPTASFGKYGEASYWTARQYIELQETFLEWVGNRVANNFSASLWINIKGQDPGQEVKQQIVEGGKQFYGGVPNAGSIFLTNGDVELKTVDPQRFPEDMIQMREIIIEKIKVAHGVVGKGDLYGLAQKEKGVTFSKDALLEEYEATQSTVIAPMQKAILEPFNLISRINGIEHIWEIEPFEMYEKKADATAANDQAEEENTLDEQEDNEIKNNE